jgi:hypothetical protein
MSPKTLTTISLCPRLKPSKNSHGRKVCAIFAVIVGLALAAATGANAQVSTINSAIVAPRIVDSADLTNAVLTAVTNYPSLISFAATNVSSTNLTGFSHIQDLWQFSADNGATAYLFKTNDYFTAYMNVTLTGSPVSPRKEAGFAFQDVSGNINGQYILDTDQGEVVAFGGNLPFYASPLNRTFVSGETITMGVTIFKDSVGNTAIIYSANGISSPVLEFGANGVFSQNGTTPSPYTLGGYFQIVGQGAGPTNSGSAVFQSIHILTQPTLNIAENGNQSVLYWAAAASNFILQSSTNLSSTNWTIVTTNGGAFVIGVAVTNKSPASFYRLISPQ